MTNQEILAKLKEFDQKLKIFDWDWDKARCYPELAQFVKEIGWVPESWV